MVSAVIKIKLCFGFSAGTWSLFVASGPASWREGGSGSEERRQQQQTPGDDASGDDPDMPGLADQTSEDETDGPPSLASDDSSSDVKSKIKNRHLPLRTSSDGDDSSDPDSSDGEGHLNFLARVVYRAHCEKGHPVGVHRSKVDGKKCYVADSCEVCQKLEEHKRAADEAAAAAAAFFASTSLRACLPRKVACILVAAASISSFVASPVSSSIGSASAAGASAAGSSPRRTRRGAP